MLAQKATRIKTEAPLGEDPSGTGISLAYPEPQQRTEKLRRNWLLHFWSH